MNSARRLYGLFERSDGRVRLLTLLGVSGLVAALAIFLVIPASAGSGGPSDAGVQPTEVSYGGGSGACAVYSDATYELHINNPTDGTFTGPDGTEVTLDVGPNDMYFSFTFVNNPTMAAWDVVVNGGSKNTHYDYIGSIGAVRTDGSLHAPTKGGSGNLYNLSHINLCYDVNPVADLSVSKTPVSVNGDPSAVDPFVANVGDTVEFEITASNAGPLDATGVTVTDTLPSGMVFDSGNAGNTGWIEAPAGTVTYALGSLASGASESLSLFVQITSGAAGQDLTNIVSVAGDQDDPNSGNDNAGSVPAVTVTADVSGIKYHDRDTDGNRDATREELLPGWTMTAFADSSDPGTSATTNASGAYTIENLAPGTYTVCEKGPNQGTLASTDPSKLPASGPGYEWAWAQSQPSGAGTADCSGFTGYLPVGYQVTVGESGNVVDVDFGNHTEVRIDCSLADVQLVLGGTGTDDNPLSTVVVPQGSPSCTNGTWLVSYDVGKSEDSDTWSQFVVFGDDSTPNTDLSKIIEQTIVWDVEAAVYVNGSLVVPTTQVLLPGGSGLTPIDLCSDLGGNPTPTAPVCLDSRTINEGGTLPAGTIQVTDNNRMLGDPGFFR